MKSQKLRKFHKKKANKVQLTSVEEAIMRTLCYRAVFTYPMSYFQLGTFLVSKERYSIEAFNEGLHSLLKKKLIINDDKGRFLLKGIRPVRWGVRAAYSKDLFAKVGDLVAILKRVPWIKFIGVTGALAAYNAVKDDDIDLFVITQKKRLWLTRGFVFLILIILGELRTDKHSKRKICPNILIDEGNLKWKKKKRNIYVAHDLVMIHPIFDKDGAYFRFVSKNSWVTKYFANLQPAFGDLGKTSYHKNVLMESLESLARVLQKGYMKKKKTKEITKKDFIHFNKSDNTNKVLSEYERILSRNL
jgi:hypothetical protein